MAKLTLNSEFPQTSRDEWQAAAGLAEGVNARAVADGFVREALYTAEDVAARGGSAAVPVVENGKWRIAQRITPAARGMNNATLLDDLAGGANVLLLDFSPLAAADLPSEKAMRDLLAGVLPEAVAVSLVPAQHGHAAIARVMSAIDEKTPLYLNYDPLGTAVLYDSASVAPADLHIDVAPFAEMGQARWLTASGAAYHAAGANVVQELAWSMATLAEYLRALTDGGLDGGMKLSPQDALGKITINLAADADFFATLAKIRAMRVMFATLIHALGASTTRGAHALGASTTRGAHALGASTTRGTHALGADMAAEIHAETSLRSFSNADPWVNILRATCAAMGAALGGVDVLCVMPCTAASTQDNALTRRLARNTQLILQEESHFDHVRDAASGSHYVEALTHDLATMAWQGFQDIEAGGGMAAYIASGAVARALRVQRDACDALVDESAWGLVGVSAFPNLDEAVLAPDARNPAYRVAGGFEKLRHAAHPVKPKVYLACLGESAAFMPRANFATNLYGAAGVGAIMGAAGVTDVGAIVQDFQESGAKIAVICGADSAYEGAGVLAEGLAAALRQAGVAHLALAGKINVAGVDDNLYAGFALMPFLRRVHKALGLEAAL